MIYKLGKHSTSIYKLASQLDQVSYTHTHTHTLYIKWGTKIDTPLFDVEVAHHTTEGI